MYKRQGLGHAIWRAKRFVGDEPFAVLLGDDIMRARTPVIGQLIAAAEKYDASCVGVQQVSTDAIAKYSSVQILSLIHIFTAFPRQSVGQTESMAENPGHAAGRRMGMRI